MKALSIRQPWAWLIVNGHKPVENRTWSTTYRGELLIHAGKEFDAPGLQSVLAAFPELASRLPAQFDLGGIVGAATLSECVTTHGSDWFTGPYGFVMRDARPLPFTPWRGELGFFNVLLAELQNVLHTATPEQAEALAGQERLF